MARHRGRFRCYAIPANSIRLFRPSQSGKIALSLPRNFARCDCRLALLRWTGQCLAMTIDDTKGWSLEIDLEIENQTKELAQNMRAGLGAGHVILLSGPIGAGKSFFARAMIRGLLADHGLAEDIPSPTFTLVQTYQAGELEIWHSDLYRLTLEDEVFELGLYDAFDTALCLVEWPERLDSVIVEGALCLDFGIPDDPDHRKLTISARDKKWDFLMERLKTDANTKAIVHD